MGLSNDQSCFLVLALSDFFIKMKAKAQFNFVPVVQWIEQLPSKERMGVRFPPGARRIRK